MWCVLAQAHTHLQKSTPAEGSVLMSSPPDIVLKFSEAARLTAAWIQKGTEPKQKLIPLPEKAANEVTVAVPALTPGSYIVSWRAVSADGHVMPGQIHFTISGGSAPAPSAPR
jgi:methionine-rich copper-binding protein CopC